MFAHPCARSSRVGRAEHHALPVGVHRAPRRRRLCGRADEQAAILPTSDHHPRQRHRPLRQRGSAPGPRPSLPDNVRPLPGRQTAIPRQQSVHQAQRPPQTRPLQEPVRGSCRKNGARVFPRNATPSSVAASRSVMRSSPYRLRHPSAKGAPANRRALKASTLSG